MAKHKVVTTDAEIDRAIAQAKNLREEPCVTSVEYRPGPGLDLLILKLSDGHRHLIPREDLQGLQSASKAQIADVEIVGNGTGLHWPALDVDHYVPSLLRRVYGSKSWMAGIGRSGGSSKSGAKKRASRINGLKGGRPRQKGALTGKVLGSYLEAQKSIIDQVVQKMGERSKGGGKLITAESAQEAVEIFRENVELSIKHPVETQRKNLAPTVQRAKSCTGRST